jgi:putative FmdB family regulatory protein
VPIYEYDCQGCRRRVSLLVRSLASTEAPRCPRCGSAELSRLMSRFATPKSEDARLEAAADPSQFGDLDENDPGSVARFVKRMGEEMGEDLGDDLDAAMDEASGDDGADLGDFGGGDFGGGDLGGSETSLSETGSGDEG